MFSQNLCSNLYADLYISYLQFLIGHLIDNYHFEKKNSLKSGGQQCHQHQQNEQLPVI
jgi:hypothetical protein